MRLSNSAHEAHAWRIREIAPDFRLEDVWALPVQGRIDDFAKLLDVIAALDPSQGASRAARALFSIRWRLGAWLGWDGSQKALPVPDNAETSLSARLPADLRGTATSPDFTRTPFTPIYRTEVEWAAELSNRTVHAVMHLAWVEKRDSVYQGQMAVYVKPRGVLGAAYMAAIAPFRHRIVYPAMMRDIERAWRRRSGDSPTPVAPSAYAQ